MSTLPTAAEPAPAHAGADDGFTLIEVLVAVAIIAVVMLGLGAVFVATASGTDAQGLRQTAVRVATDGLDRVRGLGTGVVKGRTAAAVGTTWPAAVRARLGALPVATDPGAAPGATPALPLQATSTVDGLVYTSTFSVANCQLTPAGVCLAAATANTVPMYDVVVAVGWKHSSCPASACSYQLSTLVAATSADPLFNNTVKAAAPTVTTALTQTLDKGETVDGPLVTVSGGNGSVSLTTSALPDGITFDPATTSFTGRARSVTGPLVVTVQATDQFGLFGTTQITWTVNPLPTLTAAAVPVTAGVATTVDLTGTLMRAGGTGPYRWNCGTLPAGLTLDAASGALGVLLPAVGVAAPSCTVTDDRGKSATARLTLTALAPLTVTSPPNGASVTTRRGVTVSGQLTVGGCSGTCTWQADRLPAGISLTSAGVLAGAPTTPGTTVTTYTVTDGTRTATSTVTWKVTP